MTAPRKVLMSTFHTQQRGEGKVGCIVTLLVFLSAAAIGSKVMPVIYDNNRFVEAAEDLAAKGATLTEDAIAVRLQDKAKEMAIPEALVPGAMTVAIKGDSNSGTCIVHVKFTRKVDLWGIYVYEASVDKDIQKVYMGSR